MLPTLVCMEIDFMDISLELIISSFHIAALRLVSAVSAETHRVVTLISKSLISIRLTEWGWKGREGQGRSRKVKEEKR